MTRCLWSITVCVAKVLNVISGADSCIVITVAVLYAWSKTRSAYGLRGGWSWSWQRVVGRESDFPLESRLQKVYMRVLQKS